MTLVDTFGRLSIPVNNADHSQGPVDAAVTLVEYGDYECPYCGRAYRIVKEAQQRLGGQFRFVFRNFPLRSTHPHAQHAAEAAEAAAAQGLFWEMHDALFESQSALTDRSLLRYASELGLDEQRFMADLSTHVHASRVHDDFLSGIASGVNGTPTFFVNGVRYDDSWDVDTLTEALRRSAIVGTASRPR